MRKREYYEQKYGKEKGSKLYSHLQKEAAHAAAAARIKKSLKKDAAAVALGAKGGRARAANLTKEQLSEIGKAAAAKRWPKKGGKL